MAGFHNRNAFAASVRLGYELKGCTSKRPKSFRKTFGGGLPESVYVNKDDPNYRYNYGKKYTERQLKILNGIIPYQTVRSTDLYALMKKAEQMEDYENAEKAERMYNEVRYPPDAYKPAMSYENSLKFLDDNDIF